MKRNLLKTVVFVGVCGLTWVISTRLRAMPLAERGSPFRSVGLKVETDPANPPIPFGTPANKELHIQSGAYEVEVIDNQAVVSFETKVYEDHPGFAYLWVARVMSPDASEEWNRIAYDTQVFSPKLNVELTPSFHDVIAVPRGKSLVMVSLYRFPQKNKEAMAIVHGTREEAWGYSMLQRSATVEIP